MVIGCQFGGWAMAYLWVIGGAQGVARMGLMGPMGLMTANCKSSIANHETLSLRLVRRRGTFSQVLGRSDRVLRLDRSEPPSRDRCPCKRLAPRLSRRSIGLRRVQPRACVLRSR